MLGGYARPVYPVATADLVSRAIYQHRPKQAHDLTWLFEFGWGSCYLLIARLTKDIKDQEAAGIVFYDTASALFGVAGLRVTDAGAGPGGVVEVWAVTDLAGLACCPECGTESSRVHEHAVACPRSVRRGEDPVELRWVKRRLKCGTLHARGRRSPSGSRRSRPATGSRRGMPGCSGPSPTRRSRPGRTRCWTRRPPRSRTWGSTSTGAAGRGGSGMKESGQYVQLVDRWHVNFCDLYGEQGILG
jgi:hypothetical protein